ncbi:hypothetical protein FKW77_008704 [Venturia effusa]|uniref:Uncharacterized protein n=1 Tax=Venturia effusa TaxID=50376 RepID=A0A517LCU8_9PEZI|nr:hypothetical protein FKW77_008704 [Venturia effusa]
MKFTSIVLPALVTQAMRAKTIDSDFFHGHSGDVGDRLNLSASGGSEQLPRTHKRSEEPSPSATDNPPTRRLYKRPSGPSPSGAGHRV